MTASALLRIALFLAILATAAVPLGAICIACSPLESQLRLELGQVLRYTQQLRSTQQNVAAALAIELDRPEAEWLALLDRLGVVLQCASSLEQDLDFLLASQHS